jgi:hypothetical protein
MSHALATQVWATALAPVEQEHLDQARQMQALSFAVHVPLVCFGIAFPSMIPVGYATLFLVYVALAVAVAYILLRLSRGPLDVVTQPPAVLEAHGAR